VIEDRAMELGRMLGQTDEYKRMQHAREELEKTPEVKAQMLRVEMLTEKLEPHAREGKEPPKELTDEYEKLISSIQAHPRYQQVVAAQSNFDKMMVRVNEKIVEGIKKGGESSIIIPG
jgi:cell fate (sporulation/competence/biofilm development) regulator YlbF (YheA/YmcA/DUF963 family)